VDPIQFQIGTESVAFGSSLIIQRRLSHIYYYSRREVRPAAAIEHFAMRSIQQKTGFLIQSPIKIGSVRKCFASQFIYLAMADAKVEPRLIVRSLHRSRNAAVAHLLNRHWSIHCAIECLDPANYIGTERSLSMIE
jgi:hypothetical protein